jgi:hypothetical protein
MTNVQRFIIFTWRICSDRVLLRKLKENVELWKDWGTLKSFYDYKKIGSYLMSFHQSLSEKDILKRIFALDVDALCLQLLLMTKEPEQYRELIHLQGEQAQGLLDLLQMVRFLYAPFPSCPHLPQLLDLTSLDLIFRSAFLNALLRLSQTSGLYPASLVQQRGVFLDGTDALSAGQFGDVWRGTYRGEPVAVKILKFYAKSDVTKHFKVGRGYCLALRIV